MRNRARTWDSEGRVPPGHHEGRSINRRPNSGVRYWGWLCLICGLAAGLPVFAQTPGEPQLGKSTIAQVLAALTLEEKVDLVVGEGFAFGPAASQSGGSAAGPGLDLVAGAAGATTAVPRLGIPSTVMADGPAGLRISPTRPGDPKSYYATAFPIATSLASSWDTDLVYRVGSAMGNEVREYGVDILLAPALNIQRDPLCGRNFEYYSEDPLVSGKMAAAMVRGVQSQGVGTAPKHFAANNQETNRNSVNVRVSQRALREIYLKGFQIATQAARPWTIMSSYNKLNGPYTSESWDLLTAVLRRDWSFQGLVMTDWFGGSDAVAQMKAGNDLLMPGRPDQKAAILSAVREGRLEESVLDRNVERVLELILKTPRFNQYAYSNQPDLEAHAEIARQAAAEGMVLLKNERRTLPVGAAVKSIALFGNSAYETLIGGTGSGDVNERYTVSIAEGLQDGTGGVHTELQTRYLEYLERAKQERPKPQFWFMPVEPIEEMPVPEELIARMADQSDIAVVTLGRTSGEFGDRKIAGDFNLTEVESKLIRSVSHEFRARQKRTIVVLNIGGVIETASWKADPDAILIAWQPGQEAGRAVADVLTGRVNPSGRLAASFPDKYEDGSSSANFPGVELDSDASESSSAVPSFFQGKPAEVTYAEDIYVGYRYYLTFGVPTSYEFGYGLSYTDFSYSNLKLEPGGQWGGQSLTLRVTNTGEVAGREVVQVYLASGASSRPARQLVAFAKTRLLRPQESQDIQLEIAPEDYASFDSASSSWRIDAGTYPVEVGASSEDVRLTGAFEVRQPVVVGSVYDALRPAAAIDTLQRK